MLAAQRCPTARSAEPFRITVKSVNVRAMDTTWKKWQIGAFAGGTGVLLVASLFGAPALVNGIRSGIAEPTPTAIVATPSPTPTVTPTPTPTPTPTVEAAVAPPVEEAPADPGPDLCPAGTTAQRSDGYNDLSCAPDVCLTLRGLPDPAYPECDYFHEPAYYR